MIDETLFQYELLNDTLADKLGVTFMGAYPTANALLLNIPVVDSTRWDQYVMNLTTKAWCDFTGWNGSCMAVHQEALYLGKSNAATRIWSGTSDFGNLITGYCTQAFTSLGTFIGNKYVNLMRPFFTTTGAFYHEIGTNVDYKIDTGFAATLVDASTGGTWDVSAWDLAVFGDTGTTYQPWLTPLGKLGQAVSVKCNLASNKAAVEWIATEIVYETGGVL